MSTSAGLREGVRAARALVRIGEPLTVRSFQRELRRGRIGEFWRPLPYHLTLAEAAWALVVSKSEVRRRIASGELAATTEDLPDGRFRYVILREDVLALGRELLEAGDAENGNAR